MRAAVLHTIPGELVIDEVRIDKPGPREVLVRTAAAGCCHSDLHFMEGKYPYMTPVVMGHESAGIVESVGTDVSHVEPGDHVITCLSVFCGQCDFCVAGRPNLCTKDQVRRPADAPPRLSQDGDPVFQFLDMSSFAEQMLVHEGAVVKIRDDMPLDRAALIGCGVTTGVGAVVNTAKVQVGENVVVFGLGGIGLNVIQGARLAGADRIVGVDINPDREAWGRQFGMTDFIDGRGKDRQAVINEVLALTDGGADYSFDCTGNTEVMRTALECCHRGWGESIIIGVAEAGKEIATRPFQLVTGRNWRGTAFGGARGRTDVPKIVDWYMDGKIAIDPMITHILSLEDINKGFDLMHAGESIRSVVVY